VDNHIDIQISPNELSVDGCYNYTLDNTCGGNNLFVGTVRNNNKGEDITHLEFESYVPMAIKVLKTIGQESIQKFNVQKVSIHHRIGRVDLKGIAVIISVSSKHRKEAFQACEYIIDELKSRAPIWKKEFLKKGSYWVNARP